MNIDNMKKHVVWMRENVVGNPDRGFNMESYSKGSWLAESPKEICGSVACMAGYAVLHAPEELINSCRPDQLFDYDEFTEEFFDINIGSPLYNWLFSPAWAETDNTVEGAVRRMEYTIEHGGTPDWFEDEDDMLLIPDAWWD